MKNPKPHGYFNHEGHSGFKFNFTSTFKTPTLGIRMATSLILGLVIFVAIAPFSMPIAFVILALNLFMPFVKLPAGIAGSGAAGALSDEEKDVQAALLLEVKNQTNTQLEGFKNNLAMELKSHKAFEDKIKELETKSAEVKTPADYKTIVDEVTRMGLELKSMKEKGNKHVPSLKSAINEFVEKNAAKIIEIKAAGTGIVEFKSVGSMLTTSASNPDGIPDLMGVQVAPPTNINLRESIVDGLVSKFATSLAAYPYTESVPKDGDYTFLAEAATKAEIDFKIETRYAQPKKVAAWIELSDESVQDIPGLQSIAYDYLRKKHDLKRQSGILFGVGTGVYLKGAMTYGRAFVAGGMANKVVNPNFMDIVNACITDIFTTHNYTDEMPYQANLVMIHPMDFYTQLVAAKDAFGRPLYPMASLFNRVTIGGATIIPFENAGLAEGKIFVADMSKYNVTDYIPYNVKIGWINDNLITNQFVIVAESRLHGFVKKLDEQAFIFDDIATIKTAITLVAIS